MGLLDVFQSPEGRQAIGLLAAAGPTRQPLSFGQRAQGLLQQLDAQKTEEEDRKQRQAMQAMQMMQMQEAAEARKRAMEQQQQRNSYLGGIDQSKGPAMPFNPASALAAGLQPDEIKMLAPQQGKGPEFKVVNGSLVRIDGDRVSEAFRAPEKQDLNNLIVLGPDGKPTLNTALFDAKQRLARAGATHVGVSYGAPQAGVNEAGQPVFFQPSRDGGPPSIVPGVQPPPRETPAALRTKLAENDVAIGKIDQALSAVKTYPQAFGLQNIMGDAAQQRLDPKGIEARALVADIGSQKIHDRSGAAVTAAETPRLRPFVPSANDTPDAVRKKLTLFRREYAAMQQAINSGASIHQAGKSAPPAGGAEGWSITKVPGP